MNLGFASQVSLARLQPLITEGGMLPSGYQFAPAADWILELLRRGHHVTVYTTDRSIAAPATFRGERITIRIARQRMRHTGRDLFADERRQLEEMMTADRCDLIHAHWTYQFALAALASHIPTLVTIHDLPWKVLQHFRDMHRVARLLMAYEVALRGHFFTAVSQDAADHFQRYFSRGAEIAVVPNGLPDHVFTLGSEPQRGSTGAPAFATVLQGFSRRKNATAALEAFHRVRQQLPSARLVMFGVDYEPGGPAEQWAMQRGCAESVEFAGPQEYPRLLDRVHREVDVLVHPSLDESFSMAAVEAMALRKPVIAGSETPGVREVLGFGKFGILTDVRHPEAIAAAMIRLATDLEERRRLADCGYAHARSLYKLGAVISQYESVYNKVLEN